MRKEWLGLSYLVEADRVRPEPRERGIGIVVVMLSVLVLTVLAAGIVVNARRDIYSSFNYRIDSQAAYFADAGLQATLNWFKNSYQPNNDPTAYILASSPVKVVATNQPVYFDGINNSSSYPDAGTNWTSFQANLRNKALTTSTAPPLNGSFSVKATLASTRQVVVLGKGPTMLERWRIISRSQAGGAIAEAKSVVTRFTQGGLPTYAGVSCGTGPGSLTIGDKSSGVIGLTDSYDSGVAPYTLATAGSQGNVATNGQYVQDGGIVNGSASYASITGAGTITGTSTTVASAVDCSKIPLPPTVVGSPGANQTFGGGSPALSPGSYGNVLCSSACNLTLNPGTYNLNSLEVDSGSFIHISGPTIINIVGTAPVTKALILGSGSVVNLLPPANLQILVSRTEPIVADSGTSASYVLIAPNSAVVNDSNSSTYGLIIAKTLTMDSGAQLHYDLALSRLRFVYQISPPTLVTWQRAGF